MTIFPFLRIDLKQWVGELLLDRFRARREAFKAPRQPGHSETALLRLLVAVAEDLSQASVDEVLQALISRVRDFYGADHACLHFTEPDELRDETLKAALVACPVGRVSSEDRERLAQIEAVFDRLAVHTRGPVTVDEARRRVPDWERLAHAARIADGIAIPLIHQGEVFGVINLYFHRPRRVVGIQVATLHTLGNLVYGAIQRELHLRALQEQEDAIAALAEAVEAKDPLTGGHIDRVTRLAEALGKALGLEKRDLRWLRRAAILHDVGKIGVPEAILNKPDRLSPEEFAVVRQHPEIGARILGHLKAVGIEEIIAAVRGHHERWDGTGYPDGLAGEEIPLLARIVAVVDTYDALTNDRPYRRALPLEQALAILVESRDCHLDGRLVDLFLERRLYERPWIQKSLPGGEGANGARISPEPLKASGGGME